jgi:hypothetical protein
VSEPREQDVRKMHEAIQTERLAWQQRIATLEAACARYREALGEAYQNMRNSAGQTTDTMAREALDRYADRAERAYFTTDAGAALLAEVKALREVAEAAKQEHGGNHYEPECPICAALARWEAER